VAADKDAPRRTLAVALAEQARALGDAPAATQHELDLIATNLHKVKKKKKTNG
jgi:hypothetical protein